MQEKDHYFFYRITIVVNGQLIERSMRNARCKNCTKSRTANLVIANNTNKCYSHY